MSGGIVVEFGSSRQSLCRRERGRTWSLKGEVYVKATSRSDFQSEAKYSPGRDRKQSIPLAETKKAGNSELINTGTRPRNYSSSAGKNGELALNLLLL